MRFWNRSVRTPNSTGKANQATSGVGRRFSQPSMVVRRPFASTLEPSVEVVPVINPATDLIPAEPTDRSRGGVDKLSRPGEDTDLPPYTITNLTTDRDYNANGSSTAELADVLGTLIGDLRKVLDRLDRRLRNKGI